MQQWRRFYFFSEKGYTKMLILLLFTIGAVGSEIIFECPNAWVLFGEKCYKFVSFPQEIYDNAKGACAFHTATLLGINSAPEHDFISSWLLQNDLSRTDWFTSGVIHNLAEGDMVWESDNTRIPPDLQFWLHNDNKNKTGRYIVYTYGVTQYGWTRSPGVPAHSYICEIRLEDADRIIEEDRDFDYGLDHANPNDVPRGPYMVTEPYDMIEIGHASRAVIECIARGNPQPKYNIYHTILGGEVIHVTPEIDSRYSLTNGKLVITNPREATDAGRYHCLSSNTFGTIHSQDMQLSFGNLDEFPNVAREPVRAQKYSYAVINCVPPVHKPAVAYNWLKGKEMNFIQTSLNPHIFISYNGKIYFSEVTGTDQEDYRCIVKLIANNGAIGTNQPPSRVSLPIPLQISDALATEWGPQIGNDFIAVFPRPPMRGQNTRLECLAYGTMPMVYSWRREDLPMPTTSHLEDHDRILVINNIQLEDAGSYVCHVSRGNQARDEKSFYLSVEARPYFIAPLRNQHVDIGGKLTWRCEARGMPNSQYTWLKDGEPLSPVPGDVEIAINILKIHVLAERHNGMYQCLASNTHGTSYSGAQLRVLSFKPNFVKHPLETVTLATAGGDVTIICNPEAAPFPVFTWLRDGIDLGLADGDTTSRIRKLRNGNLYIAQVQTGDDGMYTCKAENAQGSATSSGRLNVVPGSTISNGPSPTQVHKNNTAFLLCRASHRPTVDMVYEWLFQGKPINWRDPHYSRGSEHNIGGLYIRNAQFKHAGFYQCVVRTSFDKVMMNATLTVIGHAGEPSGVFASANPGTPHSMILWWTPGESHGSPIIFYAVEASTNFEPEWKIIANNIPASSTIIDGRTKRSTTVVGLKPGTGYRFRLRARNSFGTGLPSRPSDIYQTPSSAPVKAPDDVGGGGGKVGDLTVTWTPLPRADHGGTGLHYNVYWRSQGSSLWLKGEAGPTASSFVTNLALENFYSLYEVKVQGVNDIGPGPNSTIETIFSAEDMPLRAPLKVFAFRNNATAINVTWEMVPETREAVRGKVGGYQINYWERDDVDRTQRNIRFQGQVDGGLVIGLEPFGWYVFDVQVFNTAGLGPVSEDYRQRTWGNAPLLYPTEVFISSHGPNSVAVGWRGISTGRFEEPLIGYIVRFWTAMDDIRTATDIAVEKTAETVVYGVEKNNLYKLRVFGYSRGGDGKMSPDVFFTLGGMIRANPESTEIIAGGSWLTFGWVTLLGIVLTGLVALNQDGWSIL